MNWTAVSDGSEFTISSASGSIEPGSVADLSVTYSPVDYDAIDTAYVVITHDADSSPDSVMLVGAAHNDLYRTSFEEPWSALFLEALHRHQDGVGYKSVALAVGANIVILMLQMVTT